jgi:hypothetical protein
MALGALGKWEQEIVVPPRWVGSDVSNFWSLRSLKKKVGA